MTPLPLDAMIRRSRVTEIAQITKLLDDVNEGRDGALDELMKVVYEDLERVARSHLRKRFGARANSVTLEPAALVNESFMKLIRGRQTYDSRGHFFALATKVMLQVLLDYCRQRNAKKRGGDRTRITFSAAVDRAEADAGGSAGPAFGSAINVGLEPLVEAMERLEQMDPRKADVVKLRVVWGLTNDEIAASLGVSRPTVERDWRFAKAWLAEEAGAVEAP